MDQAAGKDSSSEIPESDTIRLVFPSLTAGGQGTTEAMHNFMIELTNSFWDSSDARESPILHDTAVNMLHGGPDKGSQDFMGAAMGLGVFIASAGENRVACHQAANDGYRGMYFQCFLGPDRGKGFTLVSLGEDSGVEVNAKLAARICEIQGWSGVNFETLKRQYGPTGLVKHASPRAVATSPQATGGGSTNAQGSSIDSIVGKGTLKQYEIVNAGLKAMFFDHLVPDLPDNLQLPNKTVHPFLAVSMCKLPINFATDTVTSGRVKILKCTNQQFARATNLFLETVPMWDPSAFGKDGKMMDSWETSRHSRVSIGQEELYVPVSAVSNSAEGNGNGQPNVSAGKTLKSALTGLSYRLATQEEIQQNGPHDYMTFEFAVSNEQKAVDLISVSTLYHDGNHSPAFGLDFYDPVAKEWCEWIPHTVLDGHSEHWILMGEGVEKFPKVSVQSVQNMSPTSAIGSPILRARIKVYPDGGVSRLGMYGIGEALEVLRKASSDSTAKKKSSEMIRRPDCLGSNREAFQAFLDSRTPGLWKFRHDFEIGNQQREHDVEDSAKDADRMSSLLQVPGERHSRMSVVEERTSLMIKTISSRRVSTPGTVSSLSRSSSSHSLKRTFSSALGRTSTAGSTSVYQPPLKKTKTGAVSTGTRGSSSGRASTMIPEESELASIQGALTNLASEHMGAKIMYVSNQHYGPADWCLKIDPPLGMHDGFETKRSRSTRPGCHAPYECVMLQLGSASLVGPGEAAVVPAASVAGSSAGNQFQRPYGLDSGGREISSARPLAFVIEFDFTHFVNNNPEFIEVLGYDHSGPDSQLSDEAWRGALVEKSQLVHGQGEPAGDGEAWRIVLPKTFVKSYRGNKAEFEVTESRSLTHLLVRVYPCGGFNRIKIWA